MKLLILAILQILTRVLKWQMKLNRLPFFFVCIYICTLSSGDCNTWVIAHARARAHVMITYHLSFVHTRRHHLGNEFLKELKGHNYMWSGWVTILEEINLTSLQLYLGESMHAGQGGKDMRFSDNWRQHQAVYIVKLLYKDQHGEQAKLHRTASNLIIHAVCKAG